MCVRAAAHLIFFFVSVPFSLFFLFLSQLSFSLFPFPFFVSFLFFSFSRSGDRVFVSVGSAIRLVRIGIGCLSGCLGFGHWAFAYSVWASDQVKGSGERASEEVEGNSRLSPPRADINLSIN